MNHPSFDTWTSVFLFASVQGLFVSIVLFITGKENKTPNRLLATLIFLFSVTLFEYVLYWTRYLYYWPHFMQLTENFPLLFGVILFFYFKGVFGSHILTKKDLWHLLPFVIFTIYQLPVLLSSSEIKQAWMENKQAFPSLFMWPQPMRGWKWLAWPRIAHMIFYYCLIWYNFRSHSTSNPEVRTWFKWLTGLFLAFIISYTSYFVLVRFPFFSVEWDYMISFSMMFAIFFIAWFGYLQPKVFSGFSLVESVQLPVKYKTSALATDVSNEIVDLLDEAMKNKKLYQDPEIRLEKLADAIGTTRHYLSQVINERKGMSFFEYINSLRITEAKSLLADPDKHKLNVIEIAYQVGFNNKVTFNSTFKKSTGLTPTVYRRQFSSPVLKD
ncbi:MAG: helix-turn-helix transcriptional regulator [Bacteroidia bacterium]|nr:helix-turn-helix transcriptional regulator [Bacteroidia bacterium]